MKLLKYQELNRVGELTKKQLDRTMQRLSKQRETTFQDSFDHLQHGLTSQDGIISQVNDILQQSASAKRQKKLQLFSEWDSQVTPQLMNLFGRNIASVRELHKVQQVTLPVQTGYILGLCSIPHTHKQGNP